MKVQKEEDTELLYVFMSERLLAPVAVFMFFGAVRAPGTQRTQPTGARL